MTSLAIASFSLIAGQGKAICFFSSDQISKRHVRGKAYASLFLTTLPHTSLDAGTWVWSWVIGTFSTAGSHLNYFGLKAIIGLYSFFF